MSWSAIGALWANKVIRAVFLGNNFGVLQRLAVSLLGISHSSLELDECPCSDWLLGVFLGFSSQAMWLFTFSLFLLIFHTFQDAILSRIQDNLVLPLTLSVSLFFSPSLSLSLSLSLFLHVWSTWDMHLSPIIGGSWLSKNSTFVTNSQAGSFSRSHFSDVSEIHIRCASSSKEGISQSLRDFHEDPVSKLEVKTKHPIHSPLKMEGGG